MKRDRQSPRRPDPAVNVSRAIEESLEEIAADDEAETVDLADLDGALPAEAATGEADIDARAVTPLAEQLKGIELVDAPVITTVRSDRRPEADVDLAVDAARGLRLRNPVLTASGTFGQGTEYAELIDVSRLGAIVNKGTTVLARPGNPQYRIAETPSGILNSIGLENPGAAAVAKKYAKAWAQLGVAVIVNVAGYSVDDYVTVVSEFAGIASVVAYELNVSCPNVRGGMLFGCDPGLAADVVRAVKQETDKPVIVKLTPNAPDVVAVARAVEEAGADGLTAINTVLGMRIDVAKRRPMLGTGSGGLSGPAIRPIAVHLTYQVAQAVTIPIIGAGGVTSAEDALEFLMAGASAVQVGTATFADPLAPIRIIEGLAEYVRANKLSSIRDVIGVALPPRDP